ncbi:hypothetical protein [Spiroplasma culicicola]|uniref:Transmembrane protein n=1 Tax=Spiroplasma culicicola AES-1 TaxID=1276246 RepID=W6A8Z6_9MOLU|nr:hypothetical protein [Spiroplasma culicicola]AHI53365.1 hypothetical protein SCULI_v1c10250 [Spiroplasma culicicola AES-1]
MKKNSDKKIYVSKLINIFIVLFLIFLPSLTFIMIFYINPNIKIYLNNFADIKLQFPNYFLPTKILFMSLIWSSVSFLIVGFIILSFYPFIIRNKIKHPLIKNFFTATTIATFLISLILMAFAQYNYSTFYTLYNFIGANNANMIFESDFANEFAKNYQANQNYEWSSEALTWWISLIQILITMISFSVFNSNLSTDHIGQNEEINVNLISKKNIDQSKIALLLNKISINNDKNLIIWMLIVAIIIFMPQFAYVIALSIPSANISSLLNWTFIAPDLLDIAELSEISNQGTYFAIANLPIIASSFLFGTISIFALIYIKGIQINKNFFILQFVLLLIEMLTIIAINTYSIYEINAITELWNENNIAKILNGKEDVQNLINIFGNDVWKDQNKINYLWLNGMQYVSQTVISTAFTVIVFTILGTKILKKFEKF